MSRASGRTYISLKRVMSLSLKWPMHAPSHFAASLPRKVLGKISWKPYSGDRSKSIWLIIPKSQALILSAGIRKLRLARRNYLSKYLLKSLYEFINAKLPSGLLEPLGLLFCQSVYGLALEPWPFGAAFAIWRSLAR